MVRDESKVVLQLGLARRPDIRVYTLSGRLIEVIEWKGGHICNAGWIKDDRLVVVEDSARVMVFSCIGTGFPESTSFSLGPACEQEGLQDVVIFSTGICAMTKENHIWRIRDFERQVPIRMRDPGMPGDLIHCMTVVPPPETYSESVEIIVGINEGISIVDDDNSRIFGQDQGPFGLVAASPNGLHVAVLGDNGTLSVYSLGDLALTAMISIADAFENDQEEEFPLLSVAPQLLGWCGTDLVMAYWSETATALLMTLDGKHTCWDLGPLATISFEIDGAYLISQDCVRFCRMVPQSCVQVLEPGSISPGALLHDTRRLLGDEDVRCSAEILDLVNSGQLVVAVNQCIDAAGFELNPILQQSLLRAGCFGIAFVPLSNPSGRLDFRAGRSIVDLARSLRILNALRDPDVGLPMTLVHLGGLGMPRLLDRLCNTGHFLLAFRICEALDYSTDQVISKWACGRILTAAPGTADEELYTSLKDKLGSFSSVSWSAIARYSNNCGRVGLAAELVKLDEKIEDQIPLLLEIGAIDTAFEKACKAGDPDLIYQVMHNDKTTLLSNNTKDINIKFDGLSRQLVSLTDRSQYFSLLKASGDQDMCGVHLVREALQNQGHHSVNHWKHAKECFDSTERNEDRFFGSACTAAQCLGQLQNEIETSSAREGFLGLSVCETIKRCLQLGMKPEAQKISREFKVPEKQFMILTATVMARAHDWIALQHMATKLDKKSPIQVEDILEIAQNHSAPIQSLKRLVDSIRSGESAALLEKKAKLYSAIGLHEEASLLQDSVSMNPARSSMLGNLRDAVGSTMEQFRR